MSEAAPARLPGEVIFHFDVARSSIPLSQFVDSARAAQEIIDDFNDKLFDKKIKYDIHVRTPEEGSLIEVLTIIIGVPGSVLVFLGTDIGKALFKGLTTKEPADWAEQLGNNIRQKIRKHEAQSEEAQTPEPTQKPLEGEILEAETQRQVEAEALALILLKFLEVDIDKLRSIGFTPEKFRQAFQGRNRIFKGCIDNSEVQGLTFDRELEFPIKRSEFPRQITQLPDPPVEEPPQVTDWNVETVDIIVNSPNWKQDGRKWQAATGKHQDIAFSVEDDHFWFAVDRKEIQPEIRDNMRVQWAYPAGHSKPSSVRVLRVVSYNGKPISSPLSESELTEQLNAVHMVEPDMPDLFDERRNNDDNKSKGGT